MTENQYFTAIVQLDLFFYTKTIRIFLHLPVKIPAAAIPDSLPITCGKISKVVDSPVVPMVLVRML